MARRFSDDNLLRIASIPRIWQWKHKACLCHRQAEDAQHQPPLRWKQASVQSSPFPSIAWRHYPSERSGCETDAKETHWHRETASSAQSAKSKSFKRSSVKASADHSRDVCQSRGQRDYYLATKVHWEKPLKQESWAWRWLQAHRPDKEGRCQSRQPATLLQQQAVIS